MILLKVLSPFSAINSAIEDAKKAPVLKQDTTKTPEQKLAEEKKKIEQKKKSELEKKLAEQNAAKNAEKEKAQQEKKVNELVTPETNVDNDVSKLIKEKFNAFKDWSLTQVEKL